MKNKPEKVESVESDRDNLQHVLAHLKIPEAEYAVGAYVDTAADTITVSFSKPVRDFSRAVEWKAKFPLSPLNPKP